MQYDNLSLKPNDVIVTHNTRPPGVGYLYRLCTGPCHLYIMIENPVEKAIENKTAFDDTMHCQCSQFLAFMTYDNKMLIEISYTHIIQRGNLGM